MRVYFITGTSRGIGKALAEVLLQNEDNLVIGIGRRAEFEQANYIHKNLDLSDMSRVMQFRFGEHQKADEVYLINNAGVLGEIKYVGDLDSKNLLNAFNVNLVAPGILMNSFIKAYKESDCLQTILNISSGAAVNAYDGWSGYCSTKAGVNMFTEVIQKEVSLRGRNNLRVVAVAPGIIETDMQVQIRKAESSDFSMIDKFHEMKEKAISQTPEETAQAIINYLADITADTPPFEDIRERVK